MPSGAVDGCPAEVDRRVVGPGGSTVDGGPEVAGTGVERSHQAIDRGALEKIEEPHAAAFRVVGNARVGQETPFLEQVTRPRCDSHRVAQLVNHDTEQVATTRRGAARLGVAGEGAGNV